MKAGAEPQAVEPTPHMDWNFLSIIAVSSALTAAQTTGLLNALRERPQTAAECAQSLRLHERTTKCVLDVLATIGVLEKSGAQYFMPIGRALPGHYTHGLLEAIQEVFSHTTRVLCTGETITWVDSIELRETKYPAVVGELGNSYADVAAHLAKQIDGQPERILDIGCGSGVWSLAIAERHPQAQVTGLDLPAVLDEFKARARTLKLEERISVIGGDMYEVALPVGHYDMVVIANVLRLESEQQAARLIARAASALRPGGQLLIVDAMASGMPAKELIRAAYSLLLALRTKIGSVYLPAQIIDWLHAADFSSVRELDCQIRLTEIGALISTKGTKSLEP